MSAACSRDLLRQEAKGLLEGGGGGGVALSIVLIQGGASLEYTYMPSKAKVTPWRQLHWTSLALIKR